MVTWILFQHRKSDHQQVLLQDVSLHSSGQYKCEVSAEAPSFNSVSAEASMEVVGGRTCLRQLSLSLSLSLSPTPVSLPPSRLESSFGFAPLINNPLIVVIEPAVICAPGCFSEFRFLSSRSVLPQTAEEGCESAGQIFSNARRAFASTRWNRSSQKWAVKLCRF